MPVDFLSAAQIASYGHYDEPPSVRQLERFFHFDDRDRKRIAHRRGDHNRLGFAVQLATVRFLGTFLAHPADVPPVVAKTVAKELAITDPDGLARYARREQTHREHASGIQRAYGYRDFSERTARTELSVWLDARAWTTAERPSVLFDLATARLIDAKVLLPGASVLARLIAAARDRAAERLHATLAGALTSKQRKRLRALLYVICSVAKPTPSARTAGRAVQRDRCSSRGWVWSPPMSSSRSGLSRAAQEARTPHRC